MIGPSVTLVSDNPSKSYDVLCLQGLQRLYPFRKSQIVCVMKNTRRSGLVIESGCKVKMWKSKWLVLQDIGNRRLPLPLRVGQGGKALFGGRGPWVPVPTEEQWRRAKGGQALAMPTTDRSVKARKWENQQQKGFRSIQFSFRLLRL